MWRCVNGSNSWKGGITVGARSRVLVTLIDLCLAIGAQVDGAEEAADQIYGLTVFGGSLSS